MSWRASGKAKMIEQESNGQKLTAQDKLLLMILADDYNEEAGVAWRSQPKLAAMCFCTDRGIRFSLDKLEKAGLVEVVHGGRFGNEYRLLFVSPEKPLRNTVPYQQESDDFPTGTPVPVEGPTNRKHSVSEQSVSIKSLEPTNEPLGTSTPTPVLDQNQECEKCGSTEGVTHKCPGYLSAKQRAKRAGVVERKPFPKRRPFETERPPAYQQRTYPPAQPSNYTTPKRSDDGNVEIDEDYPKL